MTSTAALIRTTGCALAVAAALACSACGSGQRPVAGQPGRVTGGQNLAGAGPASPTVPGASRRAVLVGAADVVYLSPTAGQSWSAIRLPASPATGHSIAASQGQLAAVTVDSAGMALQRSSDGGRSWRRTSIPLSVPTDQAELAVSPDGGRVAVLASVQGSANDGNTPELFVQNGAGSLLARSAPVSGNLAWAGSRLLLAGGPLNSRLYSSDDGGLSWTARAVGGAVAPRFNLAPDTASIGLPLVGADGSVLLPVTTHSGGTSSVQFYRGGSSNSFSPAVRVPLSGELGAGAVAVVSTAGPAEYLVAEPGSSTLHVVTGNSQHTLTPTGLPGPVDSLAFADAEHGLAQVTVRSCSGKQNCTSTVQVLASADGGASWTRITS